MLIGEWRQDCVQSWCVCEQENTLGCINLKVWVELYETMWGVYPFYEQYILQSSWNLLKF